MLRLAATLVINILSVAYAFDIAFDDSSFGPQGHNFGFTITHGVSATPLFDGTANATGGFAVYVNGNWQVAGDGLKLAFGPSPVAGADPAPYGAYTGVAYNWLTGNTPVVTVAKNYANGVDVAFEVSFPNGAGGTAQPNAAGAHTVIAAGLN